MEKINHPKRGKAEFLIVLELLKVESLFSVTKTQAQGDAEITYSSGLRVSETARLHNRSDSKRMTVRIRQGKGGDRYKCSYIMTSLLHLLSIRMILPNYQSSSLNSRNFYSKFIQLWNCRYYKRNKNNTKAHS